jgi:uncharacterized membrane protein YidH (DUF202 family)
VTAALEPGRQAERTVLAHLRTVLAMVVVAVLLERQATGGVERLVVTIVAVLALVVAAGFALRRDRRLRSDPRDAAPAQLGVVALSVVVLQVLAVVALFV